MSVVIFTRAFPCAAQTDVLCSLRLPSPQRSALFLLGLARTGVVLFQMHPICQGYCGLES